MAGSPFGETDTFPPPQSKKATASGGLFLFAVLNYQLDDICDCV
jgi:hypothetical protein